MIGTRCFVVVAFVVVGLVIFVKILYIFIIGIDSSTACCFLLGFRRNVIVLSKIILKKAKITTLSSKQEKRK